MAEEVHPANSYMECKDASMGLDRRLEDLGCSSNVVSGTIAPDDIEPHAWVEVDGDSIQDSECDLIVDPTIDQFDENEREYGVKISNPPSVGIYRPNDEEWEWYN